MAITLRSNTKLDKIESLLAQVFDNKTAGAETVLVSWSILRTRTLSELKGIFTEQEMHALADAYSGSMFDPQFACSNQYLKVHIEDAILFEQFTQDWGIDLIELKEKIGKLTAAQSYFITEEIQRYWSKEYSNQCSLSAFAGQFK